MLALHFVRREAVAFQATDEALREELTRAFPEIDYSSEFADLLRFSDQNFQAAFRAYLRSRYADSPPDVVIAATPSVVEFLQRGPALFPNVPIVYTTWSTVPGGVDSTGVISDIDFKGTLAAALAAQPDTRDIYVVCGRAGVDKFYRDQFMKQAMGVAGVAALHDLAGLTLSELKRTVASLPPQSFIYYVSVSEDGAGRKLPMLNVLDAVTAVANAPVYSWHEGALGHGIVGGRLHSSMNDARETARLALRVLSGERAESIPPLALDSHSYQFDWRQLQRWQIPESRLPGGSTVLFRPPSLFDQYRQSVIVGGVLVVAQFGLIAGLLIQGARRRRAEVALRESETRTSALLRAIPDLMFVFDREGRYVDYHARDTKALFAPPEEFLGKSIRDIMPAELAEMFMKALEQVQETGDPLVVAYELPIDGLRYFEARLVPSDAGRVLSIVRDVTESKRAAELNRSLAGRLIASQEAERQRIARELHDDLSQKIALLNIDIDRFSEELSGDAQRTRLKQISSQAGEIASDLHQLSHELHPSRLQNLGLIESLRALCREISQQRGLTVTFTHSDLPLNVDPNISLCLYRVTQEALHNVSKHSRAREASVQLTREGNDAYLRIADSGVGFDPALVEDGLGLVSIRERVGLLRGQLAIHARPGTGTRIGVRLPLVPPSSSGTPLISKSA